jgi:hypothetical protein
MGCCLETCSLRFDCNRPWRLRNPSISIAVANTFCRGNATTTENQQSHCPELRNEVKRFVVKHIELLPLNSSQSTRARLEAAATDMLNRRLSTLRLHSLHLLPATTNECHVRPFPEVCQKSIFDAMRRILKDACATTISMPLATHLGAKRQPVIALKYNAVIVRDKTSGIAEQEQQLRPLSKVWLFSAS